VVHTYLWSTTFKGDLWMGEIMHPLLPLAVYLSVFWDFLPDNGGDMNFVPLSRIGRQLRPRPPLAACIVEFWTCVSLFFFLRFSFVEG
jgi:hypothetical protein